MSYVVFTRSGAPLLCGDILILSFEINNTIDNFCSAILWHDSVAQCA